jgi:aerobic carbon-monoxide dehydrogenase medium subunit
VYPAPFDYLAPRSYEEALDALRRLGPDAKLLAGGCSLIPLMKLRLAEPAVLIDLNRIPGAGYIREEDGEIAIGAMTRESEIDASALLRAHCPILPEASSVIADPLVRNMGTVGGNLAHADPANDHPAVMLALGATMVIAGSAGRRSVPAGDFFQDLYTTALSADEILVEVRVRTAGSSTGSAYEKFERQVGDFPVAAVAAVVELDGATIRAASLAITNVGPVPVRAAAAGEALVGLGWDDRSLDDAAALAAEGLEPWDELRGSAEYKRDLVRTLAGRAVRRAVARARAAS